MMGLQLIHVSLMFISINAIYIHQPQSVNQSSFFRGLLYIFSDFDTDIR